MKRFCWKNPALPMALNVTPKQRHNMEKHHSIILAIEQSGLGSRNNRSFLRKMTHLWLWAWL
jgi:hypothetical protein